MNMLEWSMKLGFTKKKKNPEWPSVFITMYLKQLVRQPFVYKRYIKKNILHGTLYNKII